MKLQLAEPGMC